MGEIGNLPRLMDVGQSHDAYSAIKIALGLAEAFQVSVNDLPLSMILSWYEQKAVIVGWANIKNGFINDPILENCPPYQTQGKLEKYML